MIQGKLTTVMGDATKPAKLGEIPIVIPHVCNDLGLWGAGFVLALTRAFGPVPEQSYLNWSKGKKDSPAEKKFIKYSNKLGGFELGETQFVKVNTTLVIANMVGQQGVRTDSPRPPIRYGALGRCMRSVREVAKGAKAEIHCPMFGSDLAGGKWEVISEMILEEWTDHGINVTVYEFPKPK